MKLHQKLQVIVGPILILGSHYYFYSVIRYADKCTGLCNDTNDVWFAFVLTLILGIFSSITHLYFYRKNRASLGKFTKRISQVFCLLAWINIGFILWAIGSILIQSYI